LENWRSARGLTEGQHDLLLKRKRNDTRLGEQTLIRDKLMKWLGWDSINKEKGVRKCFPLCSADQTYLVWFEASATSHRKAEGI